MNPAISPAAARNGIIIIINIMSREPGNFARLRVLDSPGERFRSLTLTAR